MIKALFLLLLVIETILPQFCFRTKTEVQEAYFLPYGKLKKVGRMVGEDSGVVTKTVISVSDGVGGSQFPSSHISQLLTTVTLPLMLRIENVSEFGIKDTISVNLINVLLEYEQAIEDGFASVLQDDQFKQNLIDSFKIDRLTNLQRLPKANINGLLSGAATFTTSFLTSSNDKQKAKLSVLQLGDSSVAIFKLQCVSSDDCHYLPKYFTNDDTGKFNKPRQISSNQLDTIRNLLINQCKVNPRQNFVYDSFKEEIVDELKLYDFSLDEGDLVITGSDGLFDNVSIGLLTVLINYYFKYRSGELSSSNFFNDIQSAFVDLVFGQQHQNMNKMENEMNKNTRNPYNKLLEDEAKQKEKLQKKWCTELINQQNSLLSSTISNNESKHLEKNSIKAKQLKSLDKPIIDKNKRKRSKSSSNILVKNIFQNRVSFNFNMLSASNRQSEIQLNYSDNEQPNKILIDNPNHIDIDYTEDLRFSFDDCSLVDISFGELPFNEFIFKKSYIPECIKALAKSLSFDNSFINQYDSNDLSSLIANFAQDLSNNPVLFFSPFYLKGLGYGKVYRGFKKDDITVVATTIEKRNTASDFPHIDNWAKEKKEMIIEQLKDDVKSFINNIV